MITNSSIKIIKQHIHNIKLENKEEYEININKLLELQKIDLHKKTKKELQTIIQERDLIINNIINIITISNIASHNNYTLDTENITNDKLKNTILFDMYSFHEPILYKFKTPFYTNINNKHILNPKTKLKLSLLKHKTTKHILIRNKSISKKTNSFFNNLFINNTNNTSIIPYKLSKHKISKHKSLSKNNQKQKKISLLKHSTMSIKDAIYKSNKSLIHAGTLIDVRKDFTKANPNEIYDILKEQLRYYKATTPRNVQNLDNKVQFLLKDYSISQAWLKMYEIITDCNLIPTNRKGTYKSFHICEAPGTFINCINNYIHTKTDYNVFEWKAQSLKPKGAKSKATTIGDTYGLIKRYSDKWDFGVDNTGDITNIENIKYYAKIAKDMNINLMTSDCGLPWGDTKYYQVAYASYVSILYSLPNNGTLLYKILSPIDIPLIWNLIYITYTNFKEMYFFKPVQNSQSREFYIIGKGYLGTEQKVLDKLLSLIPKFEDSGVDSKFNKEEYDLFNDTYPEEFVIQVQNICERLASNYVNSIERIIYYVDNVDALGKDYKKHIESYMKEKNEDWIRKYKPMRLEKKFIL